HCTRADTAAVRTAVPDRLAAAAPRPAALVGGFSLRPVSRSLFWPAIRQRDHAVLAHPDRAGLAGSAFSMAQFLAELADHGGDPGGLPVARRAAVGRAYIDRAAWPCPAAALALDRAVSHCRQPGNCARPLAPAARAAHRIGNG